MTSNAPINSTIRRKFSRFYIRTTSSTLYAFIYLILLAPHSRYGDKAFGTRLWKLYELEMGMYTTCTPVKSTLYFVSGQAALALFLKIINKQESDPHNYPPDASTSASAR